MRCVLIHEFLSQVRILSLTLALSNTDVICLNLSLKRKNWNRLWYVIYYYTRFSTDIGDKRLSISLKKPPKNSTMSKQHCNIQPTQSKITITLTPVHKNLQQTIASLNWTTEQRYILVWSRYCYVLCETLCYSPYYFSSAEKWKISSPKVANLAGHIMFHLKD